MSPSQLSEGTAQTIAGFFREAAISAEEATEKVLPDEFPLSLADLRLYRRTIAHLRTLGVETVCYAVNNAEADRVRSIVADIQALLDKVDVRIAKVEKSA